MQHDYTYQNTYDQSQRIHWQIDDLISADKRLDFSRPFLPETFARSRALDFLSPKEQLVLNQIRAHGYLYTFGLVEEFILPFVLERVENGLADDPWRVRALLGFAGEETKHIQMFRRFREDFEAGFGSSPEVIGPPRAIAEQVLGHDPLAVAIVILHIEWMTQRHYIESVRDEQDLDPQFKNLLKHHFMEEVQHAKLDTLIVEDLAKNYGVAELDRALEEYLEIGVFLDGGLEQQAKFDRVVLERAMGRTLEPDEGEAFLQSQHQALRWTFLGSGMTHPKVLGTLGKLGARLRERVEQVAPAFC